MTKLFLNSILLLVQSICFSQTEKRIDSISFSIIASSKVEYGRVNVITTLKNESKDTLYLIGATCPININYEIESNDFHLGTSDCLAGDHSIKLTLLPFASIKDTCIVWYSHLWPSLYKGGKLRLGFKVVKSTKNENVKGKDSLLTVTRNIAWSNTLELL